MYGNFLLPLAAYFPISYAAVDASVPRESIACAAWHIGYDVVQ